MSSYFAVTNSSGDMLRVVEATAAPDEGESFTVTEIFGWTGWPAEPFPGAVLRLIEGELAWHDPRSSEQQEADARARRDRELAASDWVVTRAVERAEAVPSAWVAYRQGLRDVPEQTGFPEEIEWPAAPE